MKFISRGKGNRRWNLPVEFPLVDSDDVLVLRDRRKLPDRRKKAYDLYDFRRNPQGPGHFPAILR